jgi:hypothetical protein
MLTYIASLALMALVATPGIVGHHHCPEDYANPLCVPKGAVEELVADRGSGRVNPNQPPARQG